MYKHTSLLKQCCIFVHKTKQYGYEKDLYLFCRC